MSGLRVLTIPLGAEHFRWVAGEAKPTFFKISIDASHWWVWADDRDRWQVYPSIPRGLKQIETLPNVLPIGYSVDQSQAADWNGQDVPPVGTICEALSARTDTYRECQVLAIRGGVAVVVFPDQEELQWATALRPLRTPDQIEAEARQKAIEEMWNVYWQPDMPTAKAALGLLYDAGYRKQEAAQ